MKVKGSVKPVEFLAEPNPRDANSVVLWFRENIEKYSETDNEQAVEGYIYDEYKIVAPKNYESIYLNDEWKALAKANEPIPVKTVEDRVVISEANIEKNADMASTNGAGLDDIGSHISDLSNTIDELAATVSALAEQISKS